MNNTSTTKKQHNCFFVVLVLHKYDKETGTEASQTRKNARKRLRKNKGKKQDAKIVRLILMWSFVQENCQLQQPSSC